MTSAIDNLEAAVEHQANKAIRYSTADCCQTCERLISSAFQIKNPGTQICELCASVDKHEEER